ncbi:MAG: helix-turn-helix domain-containing protein [Deltaproteobacteria bacterium]|nr:helix-turn-helix domain-containing protein [Deltaproteobacteria bacterium]
MSRVYSSPQIAGLIGVDPSSINRWIDAGRLPAHRTLGGHRRVTARDLRSFLQSNQLPIPHELAEVEADSLQSTPLTTSTALPVEQTGAPATRILLIGAPQHLAGQLDDAVAEQSAELQLSHQPNPAAGLLQIGYQQPEIVWLADPLPGGPGSERVCEAIRQDRRFAGVFVVVAARDGRRESLLAAGADAVVRPPITGDVLSTLLDAMGE